MFRRAPVLPMLALLTAASAAQISLTTTFASNNGQSGNMFDVVATNDVVIMDLDVNLDTGTTSTVEIWTVTGGGSYVGNDTNPGAWTLLATVTGVVSLGTNAATPLGQNLQFAINSGSTQGFYVTTQTSAMNYTNGSALGSVVAQDGNLAILEGIGKSYSFGSTFSPRIWNGTIHYVLGNPVEPLVATTQGSGDLLLSGPDDPVGTVEGYVLLSATLPSSVGSGPIFGILPDALTFSLASTPAAVGNLFHYLPSPTTFPNVDFTLPPGSVAPGSAFDGVLIQVIGTTQELVVSNVARIVF